MNMKSFISFFAPGDSIPTRKLTGPAGAAALVLTVSTALVHCWMNSIGLLIAVKMNSIHLGTLMAIVFLFYPATERSPRERPSLLDWALALASLGSMAWLLLTYDRLLYANLQATFTDLAVAVLTMALLVEASRRSVGLPLTLLSVVFLAYTRLGPMLPGLFAHRGFNWERIIIRMALTDQGIYGVTLMVSSSYVFMFILFGAFLSASRRAISSTISRWPLPESTAGASQGGGGGIRPHGQHLRKRAGQRRDHRGVHNTPDEARGLPSHFAGGWRQRPAQEAS